MKHYITLLTLLLAPLATLHAADTFLLGDGQPRAEIVISDKPQRSTRLAAQELQDQIVTISGAPLPIAYRIKCPYKVSVPLLDSR